ncbi:MAG: hypothetical protein M3N53_12885 [Actinomycetota bacterium]|nr:hypothetical protein [Actinomycetota bacterium]
MAQDRTANFDMLVQISEAELNAQIATAFLAGGMFPTSLTFPIDNGNVRGTASLNFATPVADIDRPRPRLGLTVPFTNSQLDVTAPTNASFAPLGGTIMIVDTVDMVTQGSAQVATMDFNAGAPDVTVDLDAASEAMLEPALTAAGMTIAQAEAMMASVVLTELQASLGRIDLTPPIPVTDDTDPTTIFDIDVTTINDATAADRDCLAFGIRMANDSGGNINGITTSFISAGAPSVVMMSNFWLLARVMRPRVATALGRPTSDFDTPLRLNRSVPAPGGRGTLTQLDARVEGNRIRVDGRATDSGTGWSAVSNFNFFIDIGLAGGAITVTATTPSVDTDVDLEWWVWLASLGLGAVFGGIAGVIVAAIVLAIVEAVAEGIANNLVGTGIGGSLGAIPPVPLGPIGGALTLTSVVLDDMELRGSVVRSLSVPVHHQGAHASGGAFAVDLDDGSIHPASESGVDLVWDPARGLSTRMSARMTVTGISYGSLSPVGISRMALSTSSLPPSAVPFSTDVFGWFDQPQLVVGMRTDEGRLAKARAWRSLSGDLQLEWVTYDTPVPRLELTTHWSVLERGEVDEYITPDCSYCRVNPARWCGMVEAIPSLLPFPVDYQWCLCGEVITEGEGDVESNTGPLLYQLDGRRLCIETEMGQDVECEVCVSAIDARGQEHFKCVRLVQSGIERRCRQCTPGAPAFSVELIPAAVDLAGWRPLLRARTEDSEVPA